jgi:hypothetical protein
MTILDFPFFDTTLSALLVYPPPRAASPHRGGVMNGKNDTCGGFETNRFSG